jgi:hypothetical protein
MNHELGDFFLFEPCLLSRFKDLVRKLIDALQGGRSCLIRIAYGQSNRLFMLLEREETEIRFSMANDMFKEVMLKAILSTFPLTDAGRRFSISNISANFQWQMTCSNNNEH